MKKKMKTKMEMMMVKKKKATKKEQGVLLVTVAVKKNRIFQAGSSKVMSCDVPF